MLKDFYYRLKLFLVQLLCLNGELLFSILFVFSYNAAMVENKFELSWEIEIDVQRK